MSPRAATIAPNCRLSMVRAAASIQLLHAYARLLHGHTPSAAIGAATQYVFPRPARYTAGPVIALLMNSAVWIDCPTGNEGERTRANDPRGPLSPLLFLASSKRQRDAGEPIVSMQSPNEFRTGWKNRWHVIYDDVYINEKCASGRRHVPRSPPSFSVPSKPPVVDCRPMTAFIVVIINASSWTVFPSATRYINVEQSSIVRSGR